MGALTLLWAGTSPEGRHLNGQVVFSDFVMTFEVFTNFQQYLIPWARLGKASPPAEDPALGKKLWEYMDSEVQSFENDYMNDERVSSTT